MKKTTFLIFALLFFWQMGTTFAQGTCSNGKAWQETQKSCLCAEGAKWSELYARCYDDDYAAKIRNQIGEDHCDKTFTYLEGFHDCLKANMKKVQETPLDPALYEDPNNLPPQYTEELSAEAIEQNQRGKDCPEGQVFNFDKSACESKNGTTDETTDTTTDETADTPTDTTCKEGQKFSVPLDKCLNYMDWERVKVAHNECKGKPPGAEKDTCFAEVKKFEKEQTPHTDTAQKSIDDSSGSTIGKIDDGASIALSIAAAVQFFAGSAMFSWTTCVSAPLGLVVGVAVMVTRHTLKEEVEGKLKAIQAQFKTLEDTKGKLGVTYEVQVQALDYYKKALETSIEIAQLHSDAYKLSATMYGVVGTIAAIEITLGIALEATIYGAAAGALYLQCAVPAAIGGGVGLGFSAFLLKTVNDMESDYKENLVKINKILETYKQRFAGAGGLAAAINHTNQDIQSVSQSVGINSSGVGTEDQNLGAENDVTTELRPGACGSNSASGQVDEDCSECDENGENCVTFPNLQSFGAQVQQYATAVGYSDIKNDADAIMNGSMTASTLNSSAIDERYRKMQKVNRRVLKLLKKKGLSQKHLDSMNPVLAVKKHLKTNQASIAKFAKTYSNPFAVEGLDDMKIEDFVKDKKIVKGIKRNRAITMPVMAVPKRATSDIDLEMDLLGSDGLSEEGIIEETNQDEMLALARKADMDAGEYGPGVILDSNLSLFKTISNRYNVLRIKKRFSRRRNRLR